MAQGLWKGYKVNKHLKYFATGIILLGIYGGLITVIAIMLKYFAVALLLITSMVGVYCIGKLYYDAKS